MFGRERQAGNLRAGYVRQPFPFFGGGVQDLWSPFCTAKDVLTNIIIYMKKFLDCDWLRETEFFGNTVHKKGNRVQIRGNERGILIG